MLSPLLPKQQAYIYLFFLCFLNWNQYIVSLSYKCLPKTNKQKTCHLFLLVLFLLRWLPYTEPFYSLHIFDDGISWHHSNSNSNMLEELKHIYFKILKHINDAIEMNLTYEKSISFTFVNMFQCNSTINTSLCADCALCAAVATAVAKKKSKIFSKPKPTTRLPQVFIHLLYLGLLYFSFLL